MLKSEHLILPTNLTAAEWAKEINDTLCPQYQFLEIWRPATCFIRTKKFLGVTTPILEHHLIALGIGRALDRTFSVKILDCSDRSKVHAAIVRWYREWYSQCFIDDRFKVESTPKKPTRRKAVQS
jgi:hypothetical protein